MYISFFKCEPRTNIPLPIHRISEATSENKHGGETEENVHVYVNTADKHRETCMFTSFFKRELRTSSTLPIHRILKAISENEHRG